MTPIDPNSSPKALEQRCSKNMGLPDLSRLRALAPRYDKPGPRYTSYPTAPCWSDDFGELDFREALRGSSSRIGIYVHVPFCESLCSYCACNREIRRDQSAADPYLDALEVEAERIAAACGGPRERAQLALGGGTPTFLSEAQLARLCDILDRHFPGVAGMGEQSVEVDPRVTTPGHLSLLRERGFDRISLGVQDLSPRVQRAIRRVQSFEQTQAITDQSRALGFESVNFDLIYGLPFQTVESFEETLQRVLALRPDRIALYSYAHVTWVSKQQRGFERGDLPDAARKLDIFVHAMERLLGGGYRHLGLDHFALPDDELGLAADRGELRRNFMGYSTQAGLDLVALGPSGISELQGVYAQSMRTSADWAQCLSSGQLATLRGFRLQAEDVRRRALIHGLMCSGRIDIAAYEQEFEEDILTRIPDLAERLRPFEEDGLIERDAGGWWLTPEGRLFMRPVAMTLDAYLEEDSGQRFSRTI